MKKLLFLLLLAPFGANGAPDLRPDSFALQKNDLYAGEWAYFRFAVSNIGDADAGAFVARVWISTDGVLSPNDLPSVWSYSSPGLPANFVALQGSGFPRYTIVPPTLAAGQYFLIVQVDASNAVLEGDEANNIVAMPFNLIGTADNVCANNGLGNGGFENGNAVWDGPVAAVNDPAEAQGGDFYGEVCLSAPNPSFFTLRQSVILAGGDSLVLRVFAKLKNAESGGFFSFYFFDANNTQHGGTSTVVVNSTDWQAYSLAFRPSSQVAWGELRFQPNGQMGGCLLLDDICLSQIASSSESAPIEHANVLKISPNPAFDHAVLEVFSEKTQPAQIEIFDSASRLVDGFSADLTAGKNVLQLPIGQRAEGIYQVAVRLNGKVALARFVKIGF